jgi:hypothetical protein
MRAELLEMLKRLRSLFSTRDPLIEVARSGDGSLFKETFCSSRVFVVAKVDSRSLDPAPEADDPRQSSVEDSAQNTVEESLLEAFIYGPEGSEVLPVFSCREAAEMFIRNYLQAVNRVIPFVVGSLRGDHILPLLTGTIRLTLNPLTDTELELPVELQTELVR